MFSSNLKLRSEPPSPHVKVSPWLSTVIESDVSKKDFNLNLNEAPAPEVKVSPWLGRTIESDIQRNHIGFDNNQKSS